MIRDDLTFKAICAYNGNLHSGMTAALGAVVDMVLDEAAKVADNSARQPATHDRIHDAGWNNASICIAAAIRALNGANDDR